jgi:hypothetical protein
MREGPPKSMIPCILRLEDCGPFRGAGPREGRTYAYEQITDGMKWSRPAPPE